MRCTALLCAAWALGGCSLTALPEDQAEQRAGCAYRAGAPAEDTHDHFAPYGPSLPVDHILILMQENRSFDHYFQKLPAYGQPDADVAPDDFSNPGPDGKPVPIFHDTAYCFLDTAHSWGAAHRQYDDGKMDGFVVTSHGKLEDIE